MNVFTVKKEPLKENTFNIYSEMCSECEKLAEKLSLEREVLYKIWTVFRGDIEKLISEKFAVESILKFTVFSNFNREV